MTPGAMGEKYSANGTRGELDSYLIEITADILTRFDEQSGVPIIDLVLDRAGQKGTGQWDCPGRIRTRRFRAYYCPGSILALYVP